LEKTLGLADSNGNGVATIKPADTRQPMRLETLKVPRASELVADKLRSLIVDGVVQEGATMPPEKELVVQLGVSRATLREALRILEAEGLILTKTGPRGGIMVRRPGSANLTRALSLLLKLDETPFSQVLEARRLLSPMCAELAAARATEAELAELEQILHQMRQKVHDIHEYVRLQADFHSGVTACAHNDVLRMLTVSVVELISVKTTQIGLTLEEREDGIKAVEGILNALKARNGALVARRVEGHIKAFESVLEKGYN
jgi:GntR family transcriptional regulator, transcriptional repressor for pyruvate dehydrogenase complex